VGAADSVGTGSAEGVADGEGVLDAEGEDAAPDASDPVEGLGLVVADDDADPGAEAPVLEGAPDGVIVQPATTPAQMRALTAMTVRFTPSG
jgi:hypothetical protein